MCSIFGVGFQDGHSIRDKTKFKAFLDKLFINCMDRGRHASGLALVASDSIKVIKKNISSKELVNTKDYITCIDNNLLFETLENVYKGRTLSILGHCRFPTKGSANNNKNNHPIVREKVVGVHNGSIANDDFLFNKYRDKFSRYGEVDSEIIFALIEMHAKELDSIEDGIKKAYTELRGSTACAAVHTSQPHLIWLFREHNPCDILHFEDVGIVVWASSKGYIHDAIHSSGIKLGDPKAMEHYANHTLCIDVHRNIFYQKRIG